MTAVTNVLHFKLRVDVEDKQCIQNIGMQPDVRLRKYV
jgi:hypothetical protein